MASDPVSLPSKILVLLTFLGASACFLKGGQGPEKMTIEDATNLVYEVVRVHNPQAEIVRRTDKYDPDFFYFEVVVPNRVASPIVGHFAINPWTADVWNPASCEQVNSPSLGKMQRSLRAKLHLSEGDYKRLKSRKPICS